MTTYIDNTMDAERQKTLCDRLEKHMAEGRLTWLKPYYEQDPLFGVWMVLVDSALKRRVSVGVPDLSDQPYRDWFQDGMSPKEAASEVIANDDLFSIFR